MARRSPYTTVDKTNEVRAAHVKRMGDVAWKGFQCLNSECQQFIFVRLDSISDHFEITCPHCDYILQSGGETKFYDYALRDLHKDSVIEQGQFTISHDDYISEAQEYKYCIICNTLKPLAFFDKHGARLSGHQGECRLCKGVYNSIKNQTRLSDQHREAAQKRRLYMDLSGGVGINSRAVFERFNYKCFKCGKDLRNVTDQRERPLDHTLPAVYLWPLTTETATLLCREHNGEKAGNWPSRYYSVEERKRLSVITGLDFNLLNGPPQYNPDAIAHLKQANHVDALLAKFSASMPQVIKLRNRLLKDVKLDFFQVSTTISPLWVSKADEESLKTTGSLNAGQDTDGP